MAGLKERLEGSKVFFETVAAVLLSLMAILVSIAQSCTAARQTELLERQTRIAETQLQPELNLRLEFELDPDTRFYKSESLVIENSGGPAYEWTAETAEFIRVAYGAGREVHWAVHGYYLGALLSSAHRGRLITFRGQGNNQHMADLEEAVRHDSPCDPTLLDLDRYVKVAFVDALGERQVEYYSVKAVSGARRLGVTKGEEVFQRWRTGFTNGQNLDFLSIDADRVRSRLEPLCAPSPSSPS